MRRLGYALAAVTAVVLAATAGGWALAAGGFTAVTFHACLNGGKLNGVQVTGQPGCSSSATPVNWPGQASLAASPSPTVTTPTPTPTPTATATGAACVTSEPSGDCGPYLYSGITNSNGYDTYVANNCWADPSCQQTVTANGPGDWSVTAHEPAGNTAVMTYPDVQQLTNNYSADGTWSGFSDAPVSGLTALSSAYAETMPHNAGTDAQAAYDIWLSSDGSFPNEVMVWVDNVNRGDGGATQVAQATIGGQDWTLYQNGSGELIWSLGQGTFSQQGSGTVDLLALLRWLQNNGHAAAGAAVSQIDFGWEICSTGGQGETFTVSSYSITAS